MLRYHRRKANEASLLFEAMVAVAILSLVSVFIFSSLKRSLNALMTTQNYTQALSLLEEKAFQVENKSITEDGIPSGDEAGEFTEEEGFQWKLNSLKLTDLPLNEVKLTLIWQEGKRQQDVSLTTYLRNKEE